MNRKELEEKLIELKVPVALYDLDGTLGDQSYSLLQNDAKWEVVFCERGGKTLLGTFASESEACDYMLEKLRPYSK